MWEWFRTSLRPQKREKRLDDLPLSALVTQISGDLLGMRAELDSMQGTLRKLSGKIYRGVSLGDTVESDPAPTEGDDTENQITMMPDSKAELYRKAALLRRH